MTITLSQAIHSFRASLRLANRTEATLQWYGTMLGRLLDDVGDKPLAEISSGHLADVILTIKN